MENQAIGIFDTGVGGLTILRSVMKTFPHENFIFVGDNARAPYGNRSVEEIREYSSEIVSFLMKKNIKALVIACNTITALYLDVLQEQLDIPVIGVIAPTASEAVKFDDVKKIGVIATHGTIKSGAYQNVLSELNPDVQVYPLATPSFVKMVESGEYLDKATFSEVDRVLGGLKDKDLDVLVLGCTHFPYLEKSIRHALGEDIKLVDASEVIPKKLKEELSDNLCTEGGQKTILYTTGNPQKFEKIARDILPNEFEVKYIKLKEAK